MPSCLADDLERVQKRTLRIILPGQSYKEALNQLGCSRLDVRREELCLKAEKIAKAGPLVYHILEFRAVSYDYSVRK